MRIVRTVQRLGRRRWRALLALGLGLLTPMPLVAAPAAVQSFLIGNPADATVAVTRGGLLLAGGGGDVDEAWRWFLGCAGGGDVVVLRASGGDGYNAYLYNEIGGVDSVQTLLFHDRAGATDPAVLRALEQAEAIFLAGGDQARYVRFWQDTPVARALEAHVRAGKPLGGTSAGLAVLGEHSYAALEEGDLTSALALADPFDPRVTLVTGFLRLPVLRGVITDTHFSERGRLGRLTVFLARLIDAGHPADGLLGLGVDERTALAVEPDGQARVYAAGAGGRVWLVRPSGPAMLQPGHALAFPRLRVAAFQAGRTWHLLSPELPAPDHAAMVSVVAGRLVEQP